MLCLYKNIKVGSNLSYHREHIFLKKKKPTGFEVSRILKLLYIIIKNIPFFHLYGRVGSIALISQDHKTFLKYCR